MKGVRKLLPSFPLGRLPDPLQALVNHQTFMSYVHVHTYRESALYGNLILKKGVLGPDEK